MTTIERHIDIHVPAATAYSQWTQFEEMPLYMDHVKSVQQVDDRHLRWEVQVGGATRTWDAEITEQIPDKRIAWTSTNGAPNSGCVTFHRLADDLCRVMLQMEVEPQGLVEKAASGLQVIERGVVAELENFKKFLEERGGPTGRWEGAIASPDERTGEP